MAVPKDAKTHVALLKVDGVVIARVEADSFSVVFQDGGFIVKALSGEDLSLYFVDAVTISG